MVPNLVKILTFLWLALPLFSSAQEIWYEGFSLANKGVWGSTEAPYIETNFEGISTWSLDYSQLALADSNDYAKTVSTSGGRFECRDINGEAIWYSESIDISEYKNVQVKLLARETGSGANQDTKYLKAFYKLDGGPEIPFEAHAENSGNWGADTVSQSGIDGNQLQLVVYISNYYASDKVILDEIEVSGEEKNPVVIEPGDILINEVLFNPVVGGEDYVEIYNHSEKQIPLNKLYLASRDNALELTQVYSLASEKIIFEPGSYLALTNDTNGVFPWFSILCPACFLQMEKFPSYNNDEDYVVLLNDELEIIDELAYSEDLHLPVFHDREGVSLERISFSAATNNAANWHSASSSSGYGTPGYENSQAADDLPEKVSVRFSPDSFSPNNDGYNDTYTIEIQADEPGYLCNIWIYNSGGRQVLQLAQNTVLGTSETIVWDGRNESGQRQNLGVYIVLVEIYNLNGYVKQFKDGVVLTDILN